MPKYHVTVERIMRDTFTVEANNDEQAEEIAHDIFVEAHGEHEHDETSVEVEDAADDCETDN